MKNKKHSPAPWSIGTFTDGNTNKEIFSLTHSPKKTKKCWTVKPIAHFTKPADAFLCSAAPELLSVAKEWLNIWLYIREEYPDVELPFTVLNGGILNGADACGRLRNAIQKAESNTLT